MMKKKIIKKIIEYQKKEFIKINKEDIIFYKKVKKFI